MPGNEHADYLLPPWERNLTTTGNHARVDPSIFDEFRLPMHAAAQLKPIGSLLINEVSDSAATLVKPEISLQIDGQSLSQLPVDGLERQKSYAGEIINVDVQPIKYQTAAGQTLEAIAKKHLGAAASASDIKLHAAEIAQLNNIEQPEQFKASNEILFLPGHAKDGSILHKDSQGTIFSIKRDGTVQVTHKDGTGFVRSTHKNGYSDKHTGPHADDNFTVRFNNSGEMLSNDRRRLESELAKDLPAEKQRLERLAAERITISKERTDFLSNMRKFEERARLQKMPDQEVAQALKEMSRLLEATGETPVTARHRVRAALGMMRNAGDPFANDQGYHDTCNATMIENRLYARTPSVAARVVADSLLKGKYIAADGTTTIISADNLKAYSEESLNEPSNSNTRLYASQIFQTTAINTLYTKHNLQKVPPGDLRYFQVKPVNDDDTGERLYDLKKTPAQPNPLVVDGHASLDGMISMSNLITGKNEAEVFLLNRKYANRFDNKGNIFESEEDLSRKLARLQAEGKLPAILAISSMSEPMYNALKVNYKEQIYPVTEDLLDGDGHGVLVINYSERTRSGVVDDSRGGRTGFERRQTTIAEIYKMSQWVQCSEWLDRLGQELAAKRPEKEIATQLETVMKYYLDYWKSAPDVGWVVNKQDQAQSAAKYEQLLKKLSPSLAAQVKKNVDADR